MTEDPSRPAVLAGHANVTWSCAGRHYGRVGMSSGGNTSTMAAATGTRT